MKLFIDAREFVPDRTTGIGRYLENLFAPMGPAIGGFRVFALNASAEMPLSLRGPTVREIRLPRLPTVFQDQLVLPLRAMQADADYFFSPYYKIPLWGRFRRIIVVHDIMFLRRNDAGRCARFFMARQLRWATRAAALILVDSDFTGKDLSDWLPDITHKIRRLYPDLAPEWFEPVEAARKDRVKSVYARHKPFLLYVGNFKPHKNVELLIEAFASLAEQGMERGRVLVLAGGDARRQPAIETAIRRRGLAEHVRIFPQVPDADLRALYATADGFVTASCYEGFGYPLVEAMAMGCPVSCHPATSMPEVTGDAAVPIRELTAAGVAGAMVELIRMEAGPRARRIELGRRQARNFQPGTAARQLLDILPDPALTSADG
ncbi:MAG: glycosyltransferase family 4 protein [Lentisphaerae bacterium]|nr:glycosyltransferase family 4 protein [Lentisphaerota bacterium]